jgi:SpoVK/Ycf46/Vps4 family AAA+-type ATPase
MFKKKEDSIIGNYKLKELKVFGSKENLYFNIKKYRKVYDESEARYIYCELAFYNKLFDESNWNVAARFVCREADTGKQLCDFTKELEVTSDQNIIYIREGWGTPDPGWWKKGKYIWEVFMGTKSVGIAPFYIVDGGLPSPEGNPYFSIKEVRLFESPREGMPINERQYLKAFASETTRYLNVEMRLDNRSDSDYFPLELNFHFYNDAGQLKAMMTYFKEFFSKQEAIVLDTGYGSDGGGYWYEDNYTLEAIFMDQLIAIIPFTVGKENEEQEGPHPFSTDVNLEATVPTEEEKKVTFEEAKAELESLIGLKTVKEEINEMASYLQFLKIRKEKGFDENQRFNLHSVFTGNPGTGKTTVANLLGQIYHSLDLLSHGKVHEVGRADLVGEFIGQTAPKVKKALDKARGGILFIDEAYALTNRGNDAKDFGREVVEVLLKELSDGKGDLAIICAGYPKEMQGFLNSNPGLTSRIRNVVHFPDYTPDELMEIAIFTAEKGGVVMDDKARQQLHKKIVDAYRNRDEQFGNARYVNGVIEEAKQNMAIRLMQSKADLKALDKLAISTIAEDDIKKVFRESDADQVQMPVDEALLQDALGQLHELVGLEDIKREVDEMTKLVRYYREIGKNIKKSFSLHTVFKGNPGTGKTTVARLLVQIYKALGILERGHLVECDRKDLVAGYVGQTAIKTGEMLEKAMGGGLFIDEAYALTQGGETDFGREAVETILKTMEDKRGEFMVIVAGYPKEMMLFLEANPGLMSRFDKQFDFKDYTQAELFGIAISLFEKEDLRLDEGAAEYLMDYINNLMENKHKYFGNARTIRKIVAEALKRQHLRMAELPSEARTANMTRTVTDSDIKGFQLMEQDEGSRRGIGFR